MLLLSPSLFSCIFILISPTWSQRAPGLTPADFSAGAKLRRPKAPPKDPTTSKSAAPDRYEGDIKLKGGVSADSVARKLLVAPPKGLYGQARNAAKDTSRRWKGAKVPYTIDRQFSSWERGVIANAIGQYHAKTCVRFKQKTSADRDYIYFTKDDGCYSEVGRGGGRQIVSLDNGCVYEGIVMHELMHVMGFFHEQSRTDRDSAVSIKWNNILPGMDSQFTKFSSRIITDLGTRYDYGSIMHYGNTAFTKNGRDTIVPKRRGAKIGQRERLSATDLAKINAIAGCNRQPSRPSGGNSRPSTPSIGPVTAVRPVTGGTRRTKCSADSTTKCRAWARKGYCTKGSLRAFMQKRCCKSCG